MESSSVSRVMDSKSKSGQRKDGKGEWSMSYVELKNGESAHIFNPIEVGDVVEKVQNGDYTNWVKKKVDPKHDEIMKELKTIRELLEGKERIVQEPLPDFPEDFDDR